MQLNKDITKGKQKNTDAEKQRVKAFDLDRKRDSDNIIDLELLSDVDFQLNKKNITFFDTDQLELMDKVGEKEEQWIGDGEVQLTFTKLEPNKYWKDLLKSNPVDRLEPQTWWELRDKYLDEVEDLRIQQRKDEL